MTDAAYPSTSSQSSPGGRFAKFPAWLVRHLMEFPQAAIVVLITALVNRNWHERPGRRIGHWHVHQGKLAKELGVSTRTLQRAIAFLVDAGILDLVRRGVYYVDLDELDLVKLAEAKSNWRRKQNERRSPNAITAVATDAITAVAKSGANAITAVATGPDTKKVDSEVEGEVEAPRGARQAVLQGDIRWSKVQGKIEFTADGKRWLYGRLKAIADEEKIGTMLDANDFRVSLGRLNLHLLTNPHKRGVNLVPITVGWLANDLRRKAGQAKARPGSAARGHAEQVWQSVKQEAQSDEGRVRPRLDLPNKQLPEPE